MVFFAIFDLILGAILDPPTYPDMLSDVINGRSLKRFYFLYSMNQNSCKKCLSTVKLHMQFLYELGSWSAKKSTSSNQYIPLKEIANLNGYSIFIH